MSTTNTPTLDELFERIEKLLRDPEVAKYRESFEAYFRSVATGQYPVLEDSNAMFAAQCVLILVEHVRQTKF